MKDVMDLVKQKNWNGLSELCQAQHWISWFDINYGGNPEGIFPTACPPEGLHALENGIFLHVLQELFNKMFRTNTRILLDKQVHS